MIGVIKRVSVFAGLALGLQLAFTPDAEAVPAFARQTGMNCNSCHIGTYYIVPNFTRTGRLFAMRGYQVPYIREQLHAEGDTGNANEHDKYGGDYLELNWTDFFSARLISEIARGGRTPREKRSTRDPHQSTAWRFSSPAPSRTGLASGRRLVTSETTLCAR